MPSMMYAFGDDPDPLPESVAVLEEIMVDYITDLVRLLFFLLFPLARLSRVLFD